MPPDRRPPPPRLPADAERRYTFPVVREIPPPPPDPPDERTW